MKSEVSVIIPTYNMGRFLREAIQSVLRQRFGPVELIVVDDGSTDGTSLLIEDLKGSLVYIRQPNRGESSARNAGIRRARGSLLAFLDADDLWLPTKLELQVPILRNNADIGMVACGAIHLDQSGDYHHEYVPTNFANDEQLLHALSLAPIIPGSSSGVLIRKECFDAVGGFDERIRVGPDWDMWLRIAKHFSVRFLEEPLVVIRATADKPSFREASGEEHYVSLVIEKTVEPRLRRRAYSNLYYRLGLTAFSSRRGLALKYLLRSVVAWPWRRLPSSFKQHGIPVGPSRLYLLLVSLVPRSLLPIMRSQRKRWRGTQP